MKLEKYRLMLTRYPQLNQEIDMSMFLFGARQTGKSTILRHQFPGAVFIDLLDSELRMRFQRLSTVKSKQILKQFIQIIVIVLSRRC